MGGSLARVDALRRITVGPDSAGSEPGPACYGRGGTLPAVTDADLVLGRIDPDRFAGGSITLHPGIVSQAIDEVVGTPLELRAPARRPRAGDRDRQQTIPAGDRLVLMTPGGGGLGDPAGRAADLIAREIEDGLVSADIS